MSRIHRVSIVRACALVAVATAMLTVVPAVSNSFGNAPDRGGYSVIHKNGDTPVWMADAMDRAADGVWI
jgi:hypothetical protein